VGRIRPPLAAAAHDYEGRLARVLRLEVVEVRDEPLARRARSEVLQRERRAIEPHLGACRVVALDRTGRARTSEELAERLREWEEVPPQRTALVIGGAEGLHPDLVAGAAETLSLGSATLPHQLARVVLAEQLYRATTILRGEPYHR
jgi:23S rRNA (pseudouridine1915-N3)-methyltransferase